MLKFILRAIIPKVSYGILADRVMLETASPPVLKRRMIIDSPFMKFVPKMKWNELLRYERIFFMY